MKQPKPEQYHEKKRHTEDQFPYNTYLCTIPDDFAEVPVHWHEEAELIVIQKGSGTVLVDLTHYHVTAGDIIIVLPEHLEESISIRQIASACYFSESHFMKFFKTHMGISYIHYLNDVRLAHARNLLVSTNLSILEIAQKSGFENASYFNRKFKDKYGITPRQAR